MTRLEVMPLVRLVTLGVMLTAGAAEAQRRPVGGEQRATRAQLTAQLSEVERQIGTARSTDRSKLQAELAAIRTRLEVGDFRPGDRFVMRLRQDSVRSDTLVVRDSARVAVLNLPEFTVTGVLRSELEEKLAAHVSRYLRNAEVRTTQLTRVSVTGAVGNPGFYYVAPDRPINDLLTIAGGPAGDADLGKVTVSRVGKTLLNGKEAKTAVEQGQTLEALDIQSGDTVHVPLKRKADWATIIRLAFIVVSLFLAVIQFLQWYYNRPQY